MLQVPQLDFSTFKFAAGLEYASSMGAASATSDWEWTGPSQPVQHIALAAMGFGQILPIAPPASNASWTLNFWGPALQCSDVALPERDKIWTSIWNSYNATTNGSHIFLSWVPWSSTDIRAMNLDYSVDPNLPFISDIGPSPSDLSTDGEPASLFLAVLPEMRNVLVSINENRTLFQYGTEYCGFQTIQNITDSIDCNDSTFTVATVFQNSTLLQCDLVNTSYSVEFSYSSGAQDVQVLADLTGNSLIVNASAYFTGPTPNFQNCIEFQTDVTAYSPVNNGTMPCVFDINAVRLLSYQGIMAAFNNLVIGSVQNLGSSATTATKVMGTILGNTEELAFIRDWVPNNSPYANFQTTFLSEAEWAFLGLTNTNLPNSQGDLRSTLEQLFQNYTISLLAEPYFL